MSRPRLIIIYNIPMPRLTKIYTRTGDDGTTALGTTRRVSKDNPRIIAYGTVDELNALIGLALAQDLDKRLVEAFSAVQNQLFNLGAILAFPPDEAGQVEVPRIKAHHVSFLESLIDDLNEELEPLKNFVLPGGAEGAATLHVARAVCRRAERELVALSREEFVEPDCLKYINRLSDALFVMARYENEQKGAGETLWDTQV
ncbi:MAG: cob(I)yrinic acid a,c-diamide adenosyltransferase [Anaerolineales bacterium]|jgi:cob(I)alamin adenosyltransferase